MKREKVILVSCGGTGGHIMPGVALGERIGREIPDTQVIYIFSGKKIEEKFLPKIKESYVMVSEIRFAGLKSIPDVIFRFLSGVGKIMHLLFKEKVVLVVGFGSATSLVAILAGILFMKPFIILEQNAVIGRANRMVSFLAKRVYLSFPLQKGKSKKEKYKMTGNPIRMFFSGGEAVDSNKLKREMGLQENGVILLILGGSQGALSLNRAILNNMDRICKEMPDLQFVHISGKHLYGDLLESYKKHNAKFFLKEFVADMPAVYRVSDFALSRAGSSTVYELSYFGIPAVLVPYPFAMDDHQKENAEFIAGSGGALIIKDEDLKDSRYFMDKIKSLYENKQKRDEWSKLIKKAVPHDAACTIVKDIRSFL